MRSKAVYLLVTTVLLLATGCAKQALVQVPPTVDLHDYDVIGVVNFTSETQGTLASFATQRFIEALQESQPGVRVLELGSADDVKKELARDDLGLDTIRGIGERWGVGAVVLGKLDVQDVKPNLNVRQMLESASVSADVKAALTTKLVETAQGSTVWTRSARTESTVANVDVGGGRITFDARDPQKAYGTMVDQMVNDLTQDFRASYVRK